MAPHIISDPSPEFGMNRMTKLWQTFRSDPAVVADTGSFAKKAKLASTQADLKERLQEAESRPMPSVPDNETPTRAEEEYTLTDAAKELKVNPKTAKRLLLALACAPSYSCGAGDQAIFPGDRPRRRATKTRMTYKITRADIDAVLLKMRGKKPVALH
jgi:hypothetical protein